MSLRRALGAGLACLLVGVTPIIARPYTVDDLLKVEAFGQIVVAPGGRWLLFERRAPLGDAFLIDQIAEDEASNRLYRVDLAHPGPATPLIPLEASAGVTLLGLSPKGAQAAVGRFDGASWQLGIVVIATGAVRWFDVSPDYYPFRTTLGWISENQLLLIAQPAGHLPWALGAKREEEASFATAWTTRSAGSRADVTAIGSGRYLNVTPIPPSTSLVVLDLRTGAHRILAQGNFQNLTLSPDGRSAALTSEEEAIRISDPTPIGQGTELRRRRLHIVDLRSGRLWDPCPTCDLPYAMPPWSRSGRRLLFYSRDRATDWQGGRILFADVRTRHVEPLRTEDLKPTVTPHHGGFDSVGLGWIGEQPTLFARALADRTDRSDWYLVGARPPVRLTGEVAMPVARLATTSCGETLMLADPPWRLEPGGSRKLPLQGRESIEQVTAPASAADPTPPTRPLFASGRGRSRVIICSGASPSPDVEFGSGNVQPVTASVEQTAIVARVKQPFGATSLVVYRNYQPPVTVATINGFLAQVGAPRPQKIDYVSPTGRALSGWLYLPEPAADRRKPPLLVLPYASKIYGNAPPSAGFPDQLDPTMNVSILRGHGYAVLLPSLPVPPVSDDHPFDFAGPVLAAVDTVIAKGLVDPNRLAIWGHSFGGYTAAMIVSETNRFSAAIASSGPYDFASFIGTFSAAMRYDPAVQTFVQWSGYAETGPPAFGATPWDKPMRYVANSPVYRAGRIETPLMIMTSDRDFVPIGESERLFAALYRQGKDAILLSYWGEEHGLTSPANIRDAYGRIFAWLDDHLKRGSGAGVTVSGSPPGAARSVPTRPAPSAP